MTAGSQPQFTADNKAVVTAGRWTAQLGEACGEREELQVCAGMRPVQARSCSRQQTVVTARDGTARLWDVAVGLSRQVLREAWGTGS